MKTILRSVATANPALYVTREQAFETFVSRFTLQDREKELYRRILLEGPIKGRYVGMHSTAEATEDDQDRLISRFQHFGLQIAVEASRKALQSAGMAGDEVKGLVVNTCTGYLCPGLSSHVAEALALKASTRPMDIMGMGCGAALPNLQAADNMTRADSAKPVLSVAVEICSATLFMDPDPGVVISNCIFGDGAAAAVVATVPDESDEGILTLIDFESGIYPEYRDYLHYRTEKHRLRNVLTKEVPVIGARVIKDVIGRLLERHQLSPEQIDRWIVHPGGTEVLDQLAKKMGIGKEKLSHAYDIFTQYGNMSSPSVLFVLKKMIEESKPQRGELGLMLTFGAGFTAFAALVRF